MAFPLKDGLYALRGAHSTVTIGIVMGTVVSTDGGWDEIRGLPADFLAQEFANVPHQFQRVGSTVMTRQGNEGLQEVECFVHSLPPAADAFMITEIIDPVQGEFVVRLVPIERAFKRVWDPVEFRSSVLCLIYAFRLYMKFLGRKELSPAEAVQTVALFKGF